MLVADPTTPVAQAPRAVSVRTWGGGGKMQLGLSGFLLFGITTHPGMPLLLAVTPKKGAGTSAAIAPSVPAAPSAAAASSHDRGAASPSWWPRVLCRPLSSHEAGSASPSRSKETQ